MKFRLTFKTPDVTDQLFDMKESAAQADYNRQVAQSLNELLIQTEYLKKWDGKLPVYTVGSNTTPMLMLPTK